jgi:hypothetical protein
MLSFILVLSSPQTAYAFLDFVGEQSKKAVEVAAYADAATELLTEISPDEDLKAGAKDVKKRSEALRSSSSEIRGLSRSAQNVLKGPDWSSKRLDTNIKSTTDYIRRVKRMLVRVAALGTDGVVALNTTETNFALNEIQKNQQALILQNADEQLRAIEKEKEEAESWDRFSKNQRSFRKNEATSGKL